MMQTIIDQDNATMDKYVQALEAAQTELTRASDEYRAANNAPMGIDSTRSLEAAGALDDALQAYQKATNNLALSVASFWRGGYRLNRN